MRDDQMALRGDYIIPTPPPDCCLVPMLAYVDYVSAPLIHTNRCTLTTIFPGTYLYTYIIWIVNVGAVRTPHGAYISPMT